MFLTLNFSRFTIISLTITGLAAMNSTNDDNDHHIEDEKDNKDDYAFLIIGGFRPKEHYLAKYIVSLREPKQNLHYCGGSILSAKAILTAAHCVINENGLPLHSKFTIVAGTPFLTERDASMRSYEVRKVIVHPSFSMTTMRSDVAVMILLETIDLNDKDKSIVPLTDERPKSNTNCTSIGWGRIFMEGPRPIELVYVNLTLRSRFECSEYHPMSSAIICASSDDMEQRGVWQGDSGGPLICEGKLTGIVSFGYPINRAPDYFANVYEHLDWILENAGNQMTLSHSTFLSVLFIAFFNIVYA